VNKTGQVDRSNIAKAHFPGFKEKSADLDPSRYGLKRPPFSEVIENPVTAPIDRPPVPPALGPIRLTAHDFVPSQFASMTDLVLGPHVLPHVVPEILVVKPIGDSDDEALHRVVVESRPV